MTGLACVGGVQPDQMFAGLAHRADKRAGVAGSAVIDEAGVIDHGGGFQPGGHRGVTSIACSRRRDMGRTLGVLRAQAGAVVASAARCRRRDLCVVEHHLIFPSQREGLVADLALVARVQPVIVFAAGAIFTAGQHTVVATDAIAGEPAVVRRRCSPVGSRVAGNAVQRRHDVATALALRERVVMARTAYRDRGLAVIEGTCRFEQGRRNIVAAVARIGGAQADGVLADFAACTLELTWIADMAGDAGRRQRTVVHLRAGPNRHAMAGVAGQRGRNVVSRFAARRKPGAMATGAGCGGLRVIERLGRFPSGRRDVVTFFARIAGGEPGDMLAHFAGRADKRARVAGMARHAGDGERGVADLGTGPRGGVMANFARLRRGNVVGRLAQFGDRTGAVVTIGARLRRRDLRVIERLDGLPRRWLVVVADLAQVGGA